MSVSTREYRASEVAGFRRTNEAHGGFSNMAGGWPIVVEGIPVRSTEAYYQAMRFPHLPEIQEKILAETSPMIAKRKAYEFLDRSRKDWHDVNVAVMRHALRLKLSQNRARFLELFEGAAGRPIVEISTRDPFWGAKPQSDGTLVGCNVLGRLLMELRATLEADPEAWRDGVEAPTFPNATLLGRAVGFTPAPDRVPETHAQHQMDI
ncbi:NADAR family protein [Defluviimonas salinarum]|uniref:NADAR family protein n=1 Tax=Defluviimonas salinarum TaxID=2992147 RepID=A0ABT3J9F5_9RHOB|nr:NADAR family protein [Defluviimonas salinarum]MCW3784301.1 NADAR family protein [Defluviimonas salinarum]